ncbi:MAG: DNA-formamidopyrimidine glycosylase family protein [Microthrixaceae bacterium]
MPELPEVQAHVERLSRPADEDGFAGSVLSKFTPITFTALKTATPPPSDAVGTPLERVDRRGKFLLLRFGEITFVVHLMQGGRLVPDEKQSAKPRNGIARWSFDDGRALLLTEAGKERKAGVWVVSGDALGQPPLDDLGVDADSVTVDALTSALRAKGTRLNTFLRDQHGIAGVGRMLANEICHRARLSPFASTNKLTDDQIAELHRSIVECIADALAFERGLDRMSKSAERPGAVHHRKGESCPVCGDTVRAVEYNAYEVDYCPTCQTGGKVLADNTTSKFLK